MTTFYALAARLSGMAALVCAVLALLPPPAGGRADTDPNFCWDLCSKDFTPYTLDHTNCVGECGIQEAQCPSNVTNGKYTGCVKAGKACTNGETPGTCADAKSGNACTCVSK